MHNVGLVWSYLGLEEAIQRKVILFWGIVVGSENRAPEAGNKKYVAPIIYGRITIKIVTLFRKDETRLK